jgi:anti-anti-sigma regulatory factor
MPDPTKPVFLVDAYTEPVVVRIDGRASFSNSGGLKDFFAVMMRQGKHRFIVDFRLCTSMDSTFLGVLAGVALELRRQSAGGRLTLVRVGERNLELIHNLGLHRLAIVDSGDNLAPAAAGTLPIEGGIRDEIESARLMLEAHENLIATDPANTAKFQDVLAFLRNRLESR